MKLLHIIASVDPRTGGPIGALKQRALYLVSMGVETEICSLDDPGAEWVRSDEISVHALGPGVGGKYSYSSKLVPWLRKHVHKYDAVVVHGIWQYHSFATWLVLGGGTIPYFVFTHGMLDPWFKREYPLKHLKKFLYWPWADYRVLRDARGVLFTCEEERLLASKSFRLYKANELVTSYGISDPPSNGCEFIDKFFAIYPHLQGKRIILYLSRIHIKKGCDLLIKAFAKIAKRDEKLHLVMAGPDQTGWTHKLQKQALTLNIASHITWPGMLQGDLKWGAFYAAEVFCLPSHQENFGVAVAEALACGKPVLISDKVNIWREILADEAGLVANDTQTGSEDILNRWLDMNHADLITMRANARKCFENRFNVRKAAEQFLHIIRNNT